MEGSCAPYADDMSCDAQIQLAKAEVAKNMYLYDHSINYPACIRLQQRMDSDIESGLFMTVGSSKKLCVNMKPGFKDGPWKQQFQSLLGEPSQASTGAVVYTKYDQWTKAKFATA